MSKLRKSITAGLLVVAAGSFVSLNAQAGEGMGMKGNMPTFADFDLDGDGKIVEQWTVADIVGMRRQLGTLDTPVDDSASEQ